jgi:dynein heavy chain
VYEERPELEKKFFHLIENVVNDRLKIRDLENKCLDLLQSSEGNILDDEELVSTIEDSKNTANTIQRKLEQSEGTVACFLATFSREDYYMAFQNSLFRLVDKRSVKTHIESPTWIKSDLSL